MIKGIEHVAIMSNDTEKLRDWYIAKFDVKVVYDNGKGTYFVAFPNGDMIEIIKTENKGEKLSEKTAGIRHLALTIGSDDFDVMVKKIKSEGADIVADAVVTDKGIKTFFFRDIDGNVLHLIHRPIPLV